VTTDKTKYKKTILKAEGYSETVNLVDNLILDDQRKMVILLNTGIKNPRLARRMVKLLSSTIDDIEGYMKEDAA
jgi:hypothetical protein